MNDFDEWLNSIGIPTEPESVSAEITTDVQPIPVEEAEKMPSEIVVSDGVPQQPLSDDSINEILEDNGFHSEEPDFDEAEEVEEVSEEDAVEEVDDNTEESGNDTNDLSDIVSAGAAFHFVGSNERTQNGDFNVDPDTGEINVLTNEGVQTIQRDLDAEEDADWDGAIPVGNGIMDQINDVHEFEGPVTAESVVATALGDAHQDAVDALAMIAAVEKENSTPSPAPLIKPNSPTLLLDDSTSRFSGTEWYNEIQKARIILAGCGGIGSWTILQLARMTPASLFIYDDDVVEAANMSGQLYCFDDIGKAKVDAMVDMIKSYTSMKNVFAIKDRFTSSVEPGDIMICGFDNMAARRTFFERWYWHVGNKPKEERKNCLFLDGRLSIDTLQVFCITGDDEYSCDKYNHEYLFSDAEADPTQCSLKQTTYLACMIGSVIVNLFTNFVANTLNPIIPYDLPFFTEYDAQNMIFKTVK